jgi:PBSX family phage terminase large subunit
MARFAYRPPELDRRINLLIGSIRSGKTWGVHSKILHLCDYPVAGQKIITGVSKASIKTNVLNDLFSIVGRRNYHYNAQSGELRLFRSQWIVMGAKDEGSEKYIRGATVGASVCDEVVLMPQSYWQMLLSRMSPHGARLYGTTNADNPYHWLKSDVLDDAELVRDGLLWYETFTMDDNPNLDPQFIAAQKKLYTGVFYKRFIEGQWVMATGAVYGDAWSDANLYDDDTRPRGLYSPGGREGYVNHIIGVDYGTTNPCVFTDEIDDGRVLWQDAEYYWDSKVEMQQKTDQELANDLEQFIAKSRCRQRPKVIVDPSAASFKLELVKRGIWVVDADNEVSDGIRRVGSALRQRKIRVHKRCKKTIAEHAAYAWNKKSAERGVEEPVKAHDHSCDAKRYVANDVFANSWRLEAA